MTLYGEARVWLEQFPLGEAIPFNCDHLGIRYPGEVVRADTWSPGWGSSLEGEAHFRIVLLQQRRGGLRPTIQDPRIAICLPAAGLSRRRGRLAGELSSTRETQAIYLNQRDTEADLIRQTLLRRLEGLEWQLLGEDSVRYSEGQVLTGDGSGPDAASLFEGLEPAVWFSRLAGWLLSQAYPTLPISEEALPRPVEGVDAVGLCRAVFSQPEAPPYILEQLGPGLGLSSAARPEVFDPSACQASQLIRRRLSDMPGPVHWSEIHHDLAHQTGLTAPLATLFLLVCLHWERPELAVELLATHRLALLDGRPLLASRLTPDMIPAITWGERLGDWARSIGPVADPEWNDALQHLKALSPGLSQITIGDNFEQQEQVLLGDVGSLTLELARARELLDLLGRAKELLGKMGRAVGEDTEAPDIEQSLSRLSRISGDNFRSVYNSVRGVYSDYRNLEADLVLLRQLAELGRSTEDILRAQEYLEEAHVPSERFPSLSVDRQTLQVALSPTNLVESRGRNWNVLVQDVSRFKSRFFASYRTHHDTVQRHLPGYRKDLESAQRKLAALYLLNALPELGEPSGQELAEPFSELDQGPTPCTISSADLELESTPWCTSCRLSMERVLPAAQLAWLLAAVDVELGAKNRQLSTLLVERILQGQKNERLDDFLKIVQASDLAALSDTLTADLVVFIRRLLE